MRIKKWSDGAGYFARLELSNETNHDEIIIDSNSVYGLNQKLSSLLTEIFGYS
ncbi:MAG: hypothetical protein ACTSSI_01990 [Candidatus Helarchaeota archaeon]